MQVIAHDTLATLADLLEQRKTLDITDHGGMRMYTVEFDGNDILIFESNGSFWSVYPSNVFDAECGGSIHDHARAINTEQGAPNLYLDPTDGAGADD